MRRIVETTLRFPVVVVGVIIIGLVALGVPQLRDMAVDELPDHAPVSVEVQTEPLGLSAVEVEQLITAPVEQLLLNGVPWLDDISSHPPLIGDVVAGKTQGMMLVIQKFPEASTLAVTEDVEETLDVLRPGLDALRVNTDVYRPATYLPKVLETFGWLLAFCLLLVALALALVHGWRPGLVAPVTVPTSLLAATLVLQCRGEGFNELVLAGLAVVAALAPLPATLLPRGRAPMRGDSPVGRRLGSGCARALPQPGPDGVRRKGEAGADPDDRAGLRPRAAAPSGRRQHPRPRDRAPDGDRDPRRAGDVTGGQARRRQGIGRASAGDRQKDGEGGRE